MPRRTEDRAAAPKFLTTSQAAQRLGVTVNAIKAWIRANELPALRTPGGHHRIAEEDLRAFQARLADRSRRVAPVERRVLLVDDDEALVEVLAEALTQVAPHVAVARATDGYEALVQVGAFRPDVLVLDIQMPRLDGFEVCRRLKARRETRGIRILAITAYPDGQVRERILACGADDYLEKPFSVEKFRASVLGLLARGG